MSKRQQEQQEISELAKSIINNVGGSKNILNLVHLCYKFTI